jgi:eukaryotic-like serine/threonine-protein kinase
MGAQTHPGSRVLTDLGLPDRYRIVRRIARGGMGSVWCAHDVALGRPVAIKLLGEQFIDDDRAMRRFSREARTAARLSGHQNVVTIYDVGQTALRGDASPMRPFIVMEHLAGGTVGDALRAGSVEREEALRWIAEAAAALDYAHSQGVVHRDIKPGNLLLDANRVVYVADFGIARIGTEDTITSTGQLLGTAAYISPEQALGDRATEASDRYSLAVVAFELLAGERPFVAEHFTVQARRHVEQEPPPASSRSRTLPASIDPVLARGMAKRPAQRWPTAGAFADALHAALRDDRDRAATRIVPGQRPRQRGAAASQPSSVAPRDRRRTAASPRPRAVALAALTAVALGTAAAVWAGTGSSPSKPARQAAHRHAPTLYAPQARVHPPPKKPAAAPKPPPVQQTTAAEQTTAVQQTAAPQQTTTGRRAATTTTAPTATDLEARGHQLMLDGSYGQAIGVLHQALAAAAPGSLTHAYALFDLGRLLRLSGDSRAAAAILQKRLQIPNQTDVVRHELELALRARGAAAKSSGGAAATPAQPHGKAKGHKHHGSR